MRSDFWLKTERSVRTERIEGEQAIKEAVAKWRQFAIERWRNEPLRMVRGIPIPDLYPAFNFEFQNGWVGCISSLDNMRYINHGCLILAPVGASPRLKPQTVLLLEPNIAPHAHLLESVYLVRETAEVTYNPIALLYALLIRRASCVPAITKTPLTAAEILELSEQCIKPEPDGWIRFGQSFFPAKLLTIAQERL